MKNTILRQIEREERDRGRNLTQLVSNAVLHGIIAYPAVAFLYSAFYNQNLATSFQDKRAIYMAAGAGLGKLMVNLYRRHLTK